MPETGAAIFGGVVGTFVSWNLYHRGVLQEPTAKAGLALNRLPKPVGLWAGAIVGGSVLYTFAKVAHTTSKPASPTTH